MEADFVAPHRGAWIETWMTSSLTLPIIVSHPIGVRGLKRVVLDWVNKGIDVAPHRGAWIETMST